MGLDPIILSEEYFKESNVETEKVDPPEDLRTNVSQRRTSRRTDVDGVRVVGQDVLYLRQNTIDPLVVDGEVVG